MGLKKDLDEALTKITKLEKKLKDGGQTAKEFGELTEKGIKSSVKELGSLNNLLGKSVSTIKDMNKEVRDLHVGGSLDTEEAKKLNNDLKDITKQLIIIKKVKKKDDSWEEQNVQVKKLNKMIGKTKEKTNLARNSAKSFVTHMGEAGPSFMKGWASFNKASKRGQTTIQNYQGMFNKAGSSLGKMPGLMKGFGKAAKAASVTLGGITKLIAGWPGAIFMALKAVWDLGMQADQFVKDANKAFATIRGPDIMTGDVRKQFKDFNDQIFNARDNIRVGLDVTQIRELMEAMVQAGTNIQNLNKGLLSYRDAIYIAGKASKTLGLALPQVGNMIGKMLTNFRMDMESIDKAFVQVAFDAQKSGLSTDRFWSTVENASASLALYGTFVSAASKTMKAFTEDMVGGADDAAEATEDMFAVFKTGSTGAQAALLDLARGAGVSINDIFKEQATKFKARIGDIQSEIQIIEAKDTKTSEDVDQLKRLRAELSSTQSKQQRALTAVGKNSVIQTAEMGMLAGEAPKLLTAVIKKVTGVSDLTQFSGKNMERLLVAFKAMGVTGVKEKTVRALIDHARNTKNSVNNLLASSKSYFLEDGVAFQENKKDISNAILKASKPGEAQVANGQELSKLLQGSLDMDENMANTWAEIVKTDKDAAKNIAEMIKKGDDKNLKGLNALLNSSDFINKFQLTRFKSQEKTEGELAKASEESYDELVKGTLSYSEMVKMGKDELFWTMANWKVATMMNKTVADIYYLIQGESKNLSQSQKVAQEQLKLMGQQNKEIGILLKDVGEGNISAQTQIAMVQKVAENLKELDKKTAVGKGLTDTLTDAMKSSDPSKVLQESIDKAMREGNTELASILKGEKAKFESVKEKVDSDKYFKRIIDYNKKSLVDVKKERVAQEEIKTKLTILNAVNEKMFSIQKLKLMGDKESLGMIADQIHSTAGDDVKKIEKMAESLGLTLKDVEEAYKVRDLPTKKITERRIRKDRYERLEKFDKGSGEAGETAGTMGDFFQNFQGLQRPVQVTSPGSVILHPGEVVLPKAFSEFKTVPTVNEPRMIGPGGGGTTSKTVNINVSATEKDLANKIANEVRAVINQEYIGVK